jgi:peptide/nickel transport system permease protein
LLHSVALLLLISAISFLFFELAPGDYVDGMRLDPRISTETAAAWRAKYGLDQSLPVHYIRWLASAARGEFGFSFGYGMPVGQLLWPRLKNTLLLTVLAMSTSWLAALAIGLAAAASQGRPVHDLIRGVLSLLVSVPDLLIALLLLLFAVRTGFFPIGGMSEPVSSSARWPHFKDAVTHLVLPVLALTLVSLPVLVRHVEAAVRDVMEAPFIQAARAHGIRRSRLWLTYALPAAANPLISLFGLSIGGLVSASLLVEVVMGWPGVGPLLLEAIFSRDIHVVIGATMFSALFLVAGSLLADLLLYAADPRIRLET